MIVPALLVTLLAAAAPTTARPVLRVCADPNNLPFSNQRGEGFENKIATLLARSLDAELAYTWWAQRRGFFRNTLAAHACDVVLGVPARLDLVTPTRAYYRSSYVFATLRARHLRIRSFDDPRLRRLRIGIPLVGDDGANPPPAHALARRGIIDNVVGHSLLGDYRQDSPPLRLLEALAKGEIDVAVVWGPLAGYYAKAHPRTIELAPVSPAQDGAIPFVYDIAFGVRHGDIDRAQQLDRFVTRNRAAIARILDEYGVPRLPSGAD